MSIFVNLQHSIKASFLRIEKRIRFVVSAFIMTSCMLVLTLFVTDQIVFLIPFFCLLCFFLTYFSILEGIEKAEWYMLFIMPILCTVSFYFFYFLFPSRWITRIPFVLLYGFSVYALLLTSNILNVGVEKTLQLYRAAFSVNYFYQTVIIFLLLSVVLSFRIHFAGNALATFAIVFFMSVQLLWSVNPKDTLDSSILKYAIFAAFICMQISILLSFIPLKPVISALVLTANYYSLSGLIYHYLDQKLFRQTVKEYIVVMTFVFLITLLTIQW